MLKILFKTILYRMFSSFGWPKLLPFSYTLSVTFKCNSRCRTCNIWERKGQDLSLEEFKKIFASLGKSPYWVTISGGEPFLRADIVDIIKALYDICRPKVINIPTNAILCDIIPAKVEELVKYCKNSDIIVNVSIDDIGEKHDAIRGVEGNFAKASKTFSALKGLRYQNLTLGIHTVISKFNVARVKEIYAELSKLAPDSYITEIAENRQELLTMDMNIAPDADVYKEAVEFLIRETKDKHFKGAGRLTKLIRQEYYGLVNSILREKRLVIPCFAGVTTAHIAADGNVWYCCMKSESVGDLRASDYDLRKIWFTEKADLMRKAIRKEKCFCPMANMSYTNILMSPARLLKLGCKYLFKR